MAPLDEMVQRPWTNFTATEFSAEFGQDWTSFRSEASTRETPLKQYDCGVEGFLKFVRECLGFKTYKIQMDIVTAVIENDQVAVMSGHAIGKSFTSALLCVWWFCCRGYPFLTTGPTKHHVEGVLWRYINMCYAVSKRKLPGNCYKSAKIEVPGQPWWWAEGFTSSKDEGSQGWHAPNLLIVCDEYPGCHKSVESAIRSSTASNDYRLLCLGNPNEDTSTEFYAIWHDDDVGCDWFKMEISSWESPNVTGECEVDGLATRRWCEAFKRKKEKKEPDTYRMKCLGLWPLLTEDRRTIPMAWSKAATDLWFELQEEEEEYLNPPTIEKIFIDVSEGYGKDRTAMVYLAGQRVHVHRWWRPKSQTGLMKIAKYAAEFIKNLDVKPFSIAVDSDATGAGVTSRLFELKEEHPDWFGHCEVVRFLFNAGDDWTEEDKRNFANHNSWIWWQLREALDPTQPRHLRMALPPYGPDGLKGQEIRDQLYLRKWWHNKLQKKEVQSKKELRGKGKASPDVADAICGLMHRAEGTVESFVA